MMRLNVSLNERLYLRLTDEAAARGTSMASVLRMALTALLERDCWADRARQGGAPADASDLVAGLREQEVKRWRGEP